MKAFYYHPSSRYHLHDGDPAPGHYVRALCGRQVSCFLLHWDTPAAAKASGKTCCPDCDKLKRR
jgi:hypothetical protein